MPPNGFACLAIRSACICSTSSLSGTKPRCTSWRRRQDRVTRTHRSTYGSWPTPSWWDAAETGFSRSIVLRTQAFRGCVCSCAGRFGNRRNVAAEASASSTWLCRRPSHARQIELANRVSPPSNWRSGSRFSSESRNWRSPLGADVFYPTSSTHSIWRRVAHRKMLPFIAPRIASMAA